MKSAFIILARGQHHTFYSAVRNAYRESFPARHPGNKKSISDTSGWAGIILSRIHESTSNLQRVLRSQEQPVFSLWAIDCCGRCKTEENIIFASSCLNQNYAAHCLCTSRQMKENQDAKFKRRSAPALARMKHISNMLMQRLGEPSNFTFFLQ